MGATGLEALSDEELNALVLKKQQEAALSQLSDADLDKLVLAKQAQEQKTISQSDVAATALRSALEGQTAGLSEPLIAGAKGLAAGATAFVPNQDLSPEVGPSISMPQLAQARAQEAYSQDLAQREALKKELPLVDVGAQLAGALTPSPINLVGKVAKGAQALGRAAAGIKTAEAVKDAGLLARMGAGAVEGAASGVGLTAAQNVSGALTGKEAQSLAESADIGVKIGAGLPLAGKVGAALAKLPKKALSALGGVPEKVIDEVLEKPELLKNAPTIEEIKDHLDDFVFKLKDKVSSAEISVSEAKKLADVAKSELNQAINENKLLLRAKKFEARQALSQAEADLKSTWATVESGIKAVKPPTRLTDDVMDSIYDLKSQVSEGSKKAYAVLDNIEGTAEIKPVLSVLKNAQEGLKIQGKIIGESSEKAYNAIEKTKANLASLGKKVELRDAKKIIQQLDDDISYIEEAGGFSDSASRALIDARRALDSQLKDIPEYADIMAQVRDKAELLSKARKMYGKREAAFSRLYNIDNPKAVDARDVLIELGKQTGKNFEVPVSEYLAHKALSKNTEALASIKARLPEWATKEKAAASYAQLNEPNLENKMVSAMMSDSPEAFALKQVQEDVLAKEQALGVAKQALDPFKGITAQTSEGFIRSLLGSTEKNIERRKALELISQVSDKDFVDMINKARVSAQFSKSITQGSRNVNIWGMLGSAAVGAASSGDLFLGGAGGVVMGALVDRYGPAATKEILKSVSTIKGLPTVQKIKALELPPSIKNDLVTQLVNASDVLFTNDKVSVSKQELPYVSQEIMQSDMSPVEKARMIQEARKGEITQAAKLLGVKPQEKVTPESLAIEQVTKQKEFDPKKYLERKKQQRF